MKGKFEQNIRFVVLFALFLLTLAFFWNERKDIDYNNKKINHEKFASYFTIVGALTTAGTLMYLVYQTNIMKKAHLPNIILKGTKYRLRMVVRDNKEPLFKYSEGAAAVNDLDHDSSFTPEIIVKNVGSGTASNVVVRWLFSGANTGKRFSEVTPFLEAKDYAQLHLPDILTRFYERLLQNVIEANEQGEEYIGVDLYTHVAVMYQDEYGDKQRKDFDIFITPSIYSFNKTAIIEIKFHHTGE